MVISVFILFSLIQYTMVWGWEDTEFEPQYIYTPEGHKMETYSLTHISVMERWKWIVVYSPHPDDEVFGLGATMNYFKRMRFKILVVLLTHGEKSIARQRLCDLYGFCFSEEEFGRLRINEFKAAMVSLGIYHVIYDLGDQELEEKKIMQIISYYDENFDVVCHFGPAFEKGIHPDHAVTCTALKKTHVRGGKAEFGIYALFYPQFEIFKGGFPDIEVRDLMAKRDALYQYRYWNPEKGRYSIAYLTHQEFWDFLYSKSNFEIISIIIDEKMK